MELEQLLKEAYESGFKAGREAALNSRPLTSDCEEANLIMGVLYQYYRVNEAQITSSSRKHEVVVPRMVGMFLMRRYSPLSLLRIGHVFDRDHTTVMHAFKKVCDRMSYDEEFEKEIKHLEGIVEDLVVNLKPVTIFPKPQLMNKFVRPIKGRPKKKIVQVDFSMLEEPRMVGENEITFFHRAKSEYSNTGHLDLLNRYSEVI